MTINSLEQLNNSYYSNSAFLISNKSNESSLNIFDANKFNAPVLNNNGLSVEKKEGEKIDLIAHRGYTKNAPENTIVAFEEAAKNGYSTVECDIEWTKDEVPVLLHDKSINRTAKHKNGMPIIFKKNCSDLTYQELQNYDFGIKKGKEYKGTKIPTFSEFAECCEKNKLNAYIELKPTKDFDKEKAQKLIDTIKEAGMENNVTWVSFNSDYLKIMKELMPNARLGYLSEDKLSEKIVEILKNLQTSENEVFLDIKANKIDKESSETLENLGIAFEAWTVNTSKSLKKLEKLDCSGITTDNIFEEEIKNFLDK